MADADLSAVQEAVRRVLRTPLRPPLRPPDCLLVPTSRGAGERQAPRNPPSVEANPEAVRTPDPPGNVAENIFDFMISDTACASSCITHFSLRTIWIKNMICLLYARWLFTLNCAITLLCFQRDSQIFIS